MSNILDLSLFKSEKKLEDHYSKWLVNAEQEFKGDTSLKSLYKRIYYATRFLEGNLNSVFAFEKMGLFKNNECNEIKKLTKTWLQSIIAEL